MSGVNTLENLFENQWTLALFLIFFVPGFISLKVYDLLIPSEARDFTKSVFDAIAYSTLSFSSTINEGRTRSDGR
jgi:hypothetical protein